MITSNFSVTISKRSLRSKRTGTSFNFAFSFATLTACLEISTAYPFTPSTLCKILIIIQPEPVHISSTFIPGFTVFNASSTSVSVSCLGIRTLEFTLNLSPINSVSPTIYCNGICSARFLMASSYSFSRSSGRSSSICI